MLCLDEEYAEQQAKYTGGHEDDYFYPEHLGGYELVRTCFACPEQYDVCYKGEQVGYLRLRHGTFRVDYPDCGEETIYFAHTKGDGVFDLDEREYYLKQAIRAINNRHLLNSDKDLVGVRNDKVSDRERCATG
jgi:hypothetical protein